MRLEIALENSGWGLEFVVGAHKSQKDGAKRRECVYFKLVPTENMEIFRGT